MQSRFVREAAWRIVLLFTVVGALTAAGLGQTVELTRWAIPTPNSLPYGIGIGPDGKVYFTEFNGNKIGQLDPAANEIRERSVSGGPFGLVVSPSGSLFYTLSQANAVETLVFTGGSGRWNLPTPGATPQALVAAPTGPGQVNLWLTERDGGKVARFAPAQILVTLPLIITPPTMVPPTSVQIPAVITPTLPELHPGNPLLPPPIALLMPGSSPPFTEWEGVGGPRLTYRVAVAPDGRIWFTQEASPLVSLDPGSNTALYHGLPAGTQALGVIVGPNGWVWFTDTSRPAIGVLDPTTGDVRLWRIPGGIQPFDLVRDSAGNIWFTDRAANAVGYLSPFRNEIVMYPLGPNVHPVFLVLDSDERIWFTAERGNYVGRLAIVPALGPPPGGTGVLEINSTPPGLHVLIDGVLRGVTPLSLTLPAGSYNVQLLMFGLIPVWSSTEVVVAGTTRTINVQLGGAPPSGGEGTLQVNSSPAGLAVHIDGTYRGVTPLTVSLSAGTHTVQLYSGATLRWQGDVQITAGTTQVIQITVW
ncbi:MAG: hypothetical protein BIP78_0312 [Candidatus Bipolaricaulis sibiricus]|uniref:PEGA domain-containing protein n=1 Tax=Bipolaricaulis sibiricus TaxID=2501609 RepID=A0A410FT42_BIPS1|nr:MAG: hypothetical protein BIP78_0312 [Candidatus Bipolaricaulis sibiricus]